MNTASMNDYELLQAIAKHRPNPDADAPFEAFYQRHVEYVYDVLANDKANLSGYSLFTISTSALAEPVTSLVFDIAYNQAEEFRLPPAPQTAASIEILVRKWLIEIGCIFSMRYLPITRRLAGS